MISYRLKGLINLHIAATAGIITIYFLMLALAVAHTSFLPLAPDFNLPLYASPTLVGLLVSGRFWSGIAPRFHMITWADALAVTSRQIVVVALLVFGLVVATKDQAVSRLFLAFYLASAWVLLVFVNRLLPTCLAQIAFQKRNRILAVFVGRADALGGLGAWIQQKEHLGIRVAGIVSDDSVENCAASGVARLGCLDELKRVIVERSIGQVILLEIPAQQSTLIRVIETCQTTGCRLLIYQNIWEGLPVPLMPVIEQQHLFLTVYDEPLENPVNRGIKRVFDIVISLPVVVFILPFLCLLVWIVQRFQAPGQLMFKRARGGQRAQKFEMLKFRSMYAAKHDSNLESRQATRGDPRIYPFGHFLRKTSLDEFPQFINVLTGEMSIVGPRPHLPEHDQEFSAVAKTYRTRQLVKPGITGLAQVCGLRGEIIDPELLHERVKLDIQYITQWSLWLDVQITLKTLWHVCFPPKTAV